MNKLALMAAVAVAATGSNSTYGLSFSTGGGYRQHGYRTDGRGYRREKSAFQSRVDDMVRRKAEQTLEANARRDMSQQLKSIG
jgi:hypothetical protein